MNSIGRVVLALVALAPLLPFGMWPAVAQQQSAVSIEKVLSDGWEIAGYVAAFENRSLILFRHKEHRYLVQCSVLIDVMRNPRVVTYCHEIK
jgi:hypothetical protein